MDAVLMFKALVLGALYNLLDDQIAYQICDRLSFMRFLSLGLGDRVPDANTVWLYREALVQAGKRDDLFALFEGYQSRQGRDEDRPEEPHLHYAPLHAAAAPTPTPGLSRAGSSRRI